MRLLSANQPVTTLLQLVAEDVPSVADEAARTLLSLRLVPAQSVWAAALNNNEARVRRGLLKLFARTSKWQQLPICLQAAADSDPDVSERATVMLCRWVDRSNRSFVPPSSTETERSRELLANVRNPLAPRLIRDLDFILRTAAT
jgi:hypothetical protein